MGEGWGKTYLGRYSQNAWIHFTAKAGTVKTDNFCDPVAELCNCQTTIFDFNKIKRISLDE
jgi:hypothetical protein